jgi:hypothetical protein
MNITMKFAKPTEADMTAAMTIMQILNAVEDGNYPPAANGCFNETDPNEFDETDDRDLRVLHSRLMAVMDTAPGCLLRVIGGMCGVIMFDANEIVDPNSDCLELHPTLMRIAIAEQGVAKEKGDAA